MKHLDIGRSYQPVWAYFIALVALLPIISFYSFAKLKKQLADLSVQQSQADFLRGDSRTALANMYVSLRKHFISLSYQPMDGGSKILVPPGPDASEFFRSTFTTSIQPEGYNTAIGEITFTYDLTNLLLGNLLVVGIGSLLLIILIKRSKRLLEEDYSWHLQAEKALSLNLLSTQVAHDIRSPLAVLEMSERELDVIPDSTRIMIRGAVTQIRAIAQRLLDEKLGRSSASLSKLVEIEVSSLLNSSAREKEWELKGRGRSINIVCDAPEDNYFTRGNVSDLRTVLSNLMNNAADAIREHGSITLTARRFNEDIIIYVSDDGIGISEELIGNLGKEGATYGKAEGNGLGLYHAIRTCTDIGGDLDIVSTPGEGTTVIIKVPLIASPSWHLSECILQPDSYLVILDDDPGMRAAWRRRFEEEELDKRQIKLKAFSSPAEARIWISSLDMKTKKDSRFFFDFELMKDGISGLDLILDLGIESRSALVTSHYDSENLRNDCVKNHVALLPKTLVSALQIQIANEDSSNNLGDVTPEVFLLDDNLQIIKAWELSARRRNVSLRCFSTLSELMTEIDKIPIGSEIYLDSNLGGDSSGQAIAEYLHRRGFTNIYLTTGYNADSFRDLPFLKGIIGKSPPWLKA